jgi:hypothetical protein
MGVDLAESCLLLCKAHHTQRSIRRLSGYVFVLQTVCGVKSSETEVAQLSWLKPPTVSPANVDIAQLEVREKLPHV